MNYRYTHAPEGSRARALAALASVPGVAGAVKRGGAADALIAVSRP